VTVKVDDEAEIERIIAAARTAGGKLISFKRSSNRSRSFSSTSTVGKGDSSAP
jgi:hypothetical protein